MRGSYRAAEHAFEFDSHGTHWGYNTCVCVNIKFHHSPRYTKRARKRLDRLIAAGRIEDEYEIERVGFEAAQEDWWEWAKERANEFGFGKVQSAGKQGGYLVLMRYPPSAIDALCEAYERACENCDQPYEQHANGQCLFDNAHYVTTDPNMLEELNALQQYLKEARDSIDTWARDNYDERVQEEIDYRWAKWREEVKERRADDHGVRPSSHKDAVSEVRKVPTFSAA
jgi:hypothetical protein